MLRARKASEDVLIELRQRPGLPPFLEQFVDQAIARREPAALYVAVAAPDRQSDVGDDVATDDTIAIADLRKLRDRGIGLLQAADEGVVEIERAVIFSARVQLPVDLKGHAEATAAVLKFNRGEPVDGLRDVTTSVEGALRDVCERAVSYGVVNCDSKRLEDLDFSGMIDLAGTANYGGAPQARLLTDTLRNDLHAFRGGGRNVVHHPVRTRAQRQARDRQVSERMDTGLRLLAEVRRVRVPKTRP
jgi:hypothetical protein